MNTELDVSIIILTYHPNWNKLVRTLGAILMQKAVNFEIVVADDGSEQNYFEALEELFQKKGFSQFKLIKNNVNVGTVKNYLSALKAARGKYIFTTSPGDLLYDEYVIRDFYQFAMSTKSVICFGNAVYYSCTEDGKEVMFYERECNHPAHPDMFDGRYSLKMEKTAFFFGNTILGATYFRERISALEYAEKISGVSKFVEDNTTSAWAFMDRKTCRYLKRNMIWYEFGTGISTCEDKIWAGRIQNDYDRLYKKLKEEYPYDPVLDAFYFDRRSKSKWKSLLYRALRHPIVFFMTMTLRFQPKASVGCQEKERIWLREYCAQPFGE